MIERFAVPQPKVEEYLLNPDHPEGWSKAKFFRARGFRRDRPEILANALVEQAMRGWPGDEAPGPAIVKHRITEAISCPNGSAPVVLTVRRVEEGSPIANFVTARPYRLKSPHV